MDKIPILIFTALEYAYSSIIIIIVALAHEDSSLFPIAADQLTLIENNGSFSTSFTSGGAPRARS